MEVFHRDRSTMDSELSPDFQSSHQPRLQLQDQASLFHFHQGTMSVQSPGALERHVLLYQCPQHWVVCQADLSDC